jgi:1-deoxy-D-xylulose-5-phosphate reductoisomerase
MKKKHLAILGSTGSIGTQALQVVAEHPDLFDVCVLTANSQADLLIGQAKRFSPDSVVIADESKYQYVRDALADCPVKVFAGAKALCEVVEFSTVDTVVTALVGFCGLEPTVAAIKAGKQIALANKETLVVAGELVTSLAQRHHTPILPVDSEHSAIFQCLAGEPANAVSRLLLTASGGPFRQLSAAEMAGVTAQQALKHPTWKMGAKITIDSATMMNKGFEVIEAKWLFGIEPDRIDVAVHPQSIVHSAVEFADGAIKAQLGQPDMRLPIQYALTYPNRIPLSHSHLDIFKAGALTFEEPDTDKFPCLRLAYEALRRGGNTPCVLNAANEVANLAFRQGDITYPQLYETLERTIQTVPFSADASLDTYLASDKESRARAKAIIYNK